MKRRTEGFGTTEYLAFAGLTLIIFLLCTCVGSVNIALSITLIYADTLKIFPHVKIL